MVPEEDHPLWNLDAWHQLTRYGGESLCWGHSGALGQMSLVNWLPNVSTQSRVFISGNEILGTVTYIPVGGGAGEMAMGGKNGWEAKSMGGHVGHGWCSE